MSKGNMLLGQARGKVGSLVFARQDGKQIVRSRAEVVKNPQTEKQMIQRIFMNTIAQAYSNMSQIVDHSFEGVAPGQASMSFFISKNLKALRERVAQQIAGGDSNDEIFSFTPIGSSIFVPNNYLVAKGKLPAVPVISANSDTEMAIALSDNTYAAFISDYGLKRGDQITFMAIIGNSAADAKLAFCRVILDPRTADDVAADITSQLIVDGAINLPSPRNEGTFVTITQAAGKLTFGFGTSYLMAAAVIVSRQNSDGSWLRSNASMVDNGTSALYYDLQTCLDMVNSGSIGTLSQRYLNNAGAQRIMQATTGPATYNVAVSVDPVGGGSVTGGGSYTDGSTAQLTATPASGKEFVGWKIAGSSTYISRENPYSFQVTANVQIVAVFEDAMP